MSALESLLQEGQGIAAGEKLVREGQLLAEGDRLARAGPAAGGPKWANLGLPLELDTALQQHGAIPTSGQVGDARFRFPHGPLTNAGTPSPHRFPGVYDVQIPKGSPEQYDALQQTLTGLGYSILPENPGSKWSRAKSTILHVDTRRGPPSLGSLRGHGLRYTTGPTATPRPVVPAVPESAISQMLNRAAAWPAARPKPERNVTLDPYRQAELDLSSGAAAERMAAQDARSQEAQITTRAMAGRSAASLVPPEETGGPSPAEMVLTAAAPPAPKTLKEAAAESVGHYAGGVGHMALGGARALTFGGLNRILPLPTDPEAQMEETLGGLTTALIPGLGAEALTLGGLRLLPGVRTAMEARGIAGTLARTGVGAARQAAGWSTMVLAADLGRGVPLPEALENAKKAAVTGAVVGGAGGLAPDLVRGLARANAARRGLLTETEATGPDIIHQEIGRSEAGRNLIRHIGQSTRDSVAAHIDSHFPLTPAEEEEVVRALQRPGGEADLAAHGTPNQQAAFAYARSLDDQLHQTGQSAGFAPSYLENHFPRWGVAPNAAGTVQSGGGGQTLSGSLRPGFFKRRSILTMEERAALSYQDITSIPDLVAKRTEDVLTNLNQVQTDKALLTRPIVDVPVQSTRGAAVRRLLGIRPGPSISIRPAITEFTPEARAAGYKAETMPGATAPPPLGGASQPFNAALAHRGVMQEARAAGAGEETTTVLRDLDRVHEDMLTNAADTAEAQARHHAGQVGQLTRLAARAEQRANAYVGQAAAVRRSGGRTAVAVNLETRAVQEQGAAQGLRVAAGQHQAAVEGIVGRPVRVQGGRLTSTVVKELRARASEAARPAADAHQLTLIADPAYLSPQARPFVERVRLLRAANPEVTVTRPTLKAVHPVLKKLMARTERPGMPDPGLETWARGVANRLWEDYRAVAMSPGAGTMHPRNILSELSLLRGGSLTDALADVWRGWKTLRAGGPEVEAMVRDGLELRADASWKRDTANTLAQMAGHEPAEMGQGTRIPGLARVNRWTFGTFIPAMQVASYRIARNLVDTYWPELSAFERGRMAATMSNDLSGHLPYYFKTPAMRTWLRAGFFAPNWTISKARIPWAAQMPGQFFKGSSPFGKPAMQGEYGALTVQTLLSYFGWLDAMNLAGSGKHITQNVSNQLTRINTGVDLPGGRVLYQNPILYPSGKEVIEPAPQRLADLASPGAWASAVGGRVMTKASPVTRLLAAALTRRNPESGEEINPQWMYPEEKTAGWFKQVMGESPLARYGTQEGVFRTPAERIAAGALGTSYSHGQPTEHALTQTNLSQRATAVKAAARAKINVLTLEGRDDEAIEVAKSVFSPQEARSVLRLARARLVNPEAARARRFKGIAPALTDEQRRQYQEAP